MIMGMTEYIFMSRRQWGQWFSLYLSTSISWHSPCKSVEFWMNYGLISWYYLLKTGELWSKDSGPGSPYRRLAYSPCWKYIQLFTTLCYVWGRKINIFYSILFYALFSSTKSKLVVNTWVWHQDYLRNGIFVRRLHCLFKLYFCIIIWARICDVKVAQESIPRYRFRQPM